MLFFWGHTRPASQKSPSDTTLYKILSSLQGTHTSNSIIPPKMYIMISGPQLFIPYNKNSTHNAHSQETNSYKYMYVYVSQHHKLQWITVRAKCVYASWIWCRKISVSWNVGLTIHKGNFKRGAAASKNTTSSSHIIYTFLAGGLSSTAHHHGPTKSLHRFM